MLTSLKGQADSLPRLTCCDAVGASALSYPCWGPTPFPLLPSRDRKQRSTPKPHSHCPASQNPTLTVLSPIHPQEHKGTGKAELVVSSIHSEKLEEHESFLENPAEKIPSCFTFPELDIENGQSAEVGRLCVPHNWVFFVVLFFGFFSIQEEQDNHRKQKIN